MSRLESKNLLGPTTGHQLSRMTSVYEPSFEVGPHCSYTEIASPLTLHKRKVVCDPSLGFHSPETAYDLQSTNPRVKRLRLFLSEHPDNTSLRNADLSAKDWDSDSDV